MPKEKMDGYLIHVETRDMRKPRGVQHSVVTTEKIPVSSIYDATVVLVQCLRGHNFPQNRIAEAMEEWLGFFIDVEKSKGILPRATLTGMLGIQSAINEFWYEPFTAESRDDYEKSVGLQKDYPEGGVGKRFPVCEYCGVRHDPHGGCPGDDEEDED